MPLDPDKIRMVTEKFETLSKRFDAFMEQKAINDEDDDDDDDEDEDEDEDEIEEELREPAEEALRNSPGSDLANPDLDEPWYGR
jgi:hypothetical protein